jgi:acetyl-CoA C-acetyltransferase
MSGGSSRRYPLELRERAVRMVAEVSDQHDSEWAAISEADRRDVDHLARGDGTVALTSHQRAQAAIRAGHFENEIIDVDGFRTDEGPRDTSLDKMATLNTLVEGGRLTAAMASQISDGASAVLLASEQAVKDHNLTPRARIHHISARGADPVFMLTGPIPATRYALEKTGLSIDDIDTVEINEAFAPVVQAWHKEIKADPKKVNPNGGAIALGHPLGATGAKLFTTMLNTLERTGGRYGLQTMCEGGGTANVTIIERL